MASGTGSDSALLFDLAKEAFHRQIEKRVRPLARSYVERWMGCEFWLYPAVVTRHATELHAYKALVLEVLRKSTVDEMLALCRKTRPDLDDLWTMPAAREKLTREIEEAVKAVEAA